MTGRQIVGDLAVAPGADAGAAIGGDVERMPSGRHGAGEFAAVVERELQMRGVWEFAAMGQRFGKISAAIPFRAARGVRLKRTFSLKQRPRAHRPALIERKAQRVGAVGRMNGGRMNR